MVDPTLSFGQPTVAEAGIPTSVLAEALEAEAESDPSTALQRVAWVYKVPERHVHAATRFEQWLRAA